MADTFQKHVSEVATEVGTIIITFQTIDDIEEPKMSYSIRLKNAQGENVKFKGENGDLRPFLTPTQITTIETFLTNIRTKAAEMLT
jgi:hypothetical protein